MQRAGSTGSRFRGVPAAVKEISRGGSASLLEAAVVGSDVSSISLVVSFVCIVVIGIIDMVSSSVEEVDEGLDESAAIGDCRY